MLRAEAGGVRRGREERETQSVAASIPSSQTPASPAQLASDLAKFRPAELERRREGREASRSGLLQFLAASLVPRHNLGQRGSCLAGC